MVNWLLLLITKCKELCGRDVKQPDCQEAHLYHVQGCAADQYNDHHQDTFQQQSLLRAMLSGLRMSS